MKIDWQHESLFTTKPEDLTEDQLLALEFNSYLMQNYCIRWKLPECKNFFKNLEATTLR